jgi:hypothetical protein
MDRRRRRRSHSGLGSPASGMSFEIAAVRRARASMSPRLGAARSAPGGAVQPTFHDLRYTCRACRHPEADNRRVRPWVYGGSRGGPAVWPWCQWPGPV